MQAHSSFGVPNELMFDATWEHIRPSGEPFRGTLRTAELTRAEFELLYWEMRGRP